MMRAFRTAAPVLLLALLTAGCGDGMPGFSRSDDNEDGFPADEDTRFAILTEDGRVKLGLTEEVVYARLSDETLREVTEELEEEADDEGLGGLIASAIKKGVSEGLRFRLTVDVDDIRDIRWEDGRLVVELEEGGVAFEDTELDGEELGKAFKRGEAQAFANAFRELKAGR